MKIAFTSCAYLQKYPIQLGWQRIQQLEPDVLLLLGDQIYMDFGLPRFGGDLYVPRKFSLTEFASRMYDRYRHQYTEQYFRNLLESRPDMRIAATWDDHDFAWNNACGGRCQKPEPDEQVTRIIKDGMQHKVPDDKKWVTRKLFMQYLETVRARKEDYPPPPFDLSNPPTDQILSDLGIQEAFDLEGGQIRVLMLDVRYHRDCRLYMEDNASHARIMDDAQMTWLREQLNGNQEVTLICSGSTLTDAECWKQYPRSYGELLSASAGKKVLVLTGDIHQNKFHAHNNPHNKEIRLFEAISSGIAIRGLKPFLWLGDQENFGSLEIDNTQLTINLYRRRGAIESHRINRATWQEQEISAKSFGIPG
ncbi:MAG: alkaline phosphatase D family protein [Gallionellaceae bacterium]|nr:alkaline phosphatase D family protein [Gallionellaceae bacterium]